MQQETILLTFLGTGKYEKAAYQVGNHPLAAEVFFSAALATALKPGNVISLQTPGAAEKHGTALNQRFEELGIPHQAAKIPEGKSEAELWDIFKAITEAVPERCLLHLDITHGFRSLPILGFIALNYLRTTRNVTLGGVHYGAYDAIRDGVVPAFDLSPFLALLDWTSAADQFLATGSATRMATLLRNIQQTEWQNPGDHSTAELPTKLISLGSTLEAAANNLTLLRTGAMMKSAASVDRQIDNASRGKDLSHFALPFLEVLQPVRDDLTRFNSTDLPVLLDLVGWLIQKNRPETALTLASEWLVSWIMIQLGNTNHHSSESIRKPYDQCLNLWISEHSEQGVITAPSTESTTLLAELKNLLDPAIMMTLAKVGARLKAARNDLNHAGFRQGPMAWNSIISAATGIYGDLCLLPLAIDPP